MSLFTELKRRNVIRVALFYVVAAWLLVQVAETVLPLFDVPAGVLRGLVILLALGFLPALVFAWVYELTPQGLKRDADVEVSEQTRQKSARKLNWATLLVALLAIGLLLTDRLLPRSPPPSPPSFSETLPLAQPAEVAPAVLDSSIAVLPFADLSPGGATSSTSPTASPRRSSMSCPESRRSASPRARRPLPSRARANSAFPISPLRWACATCWKAPCARRPTPFASPPS